jgi:hypothetical protein
MLTDEDWNDLLEPIASKNCTPFIGAGASAGTLPTGGAIARRWAKEYSYPLTDASDLARVAQFLALRRHDMFPKTTLIKEFAKVNPPDFTKPDEPHAVLADLELPIYITTNYDPFMTRAIESRNRPVEREICRWNRHPAVIGKPCIFDKEYDPSPAKPLVFHLHGTLELPQSMVLTESDYLDFLITLSQDQTNQNLLPAAIRKALAGTALLFMGYSLSDWDLRVLLRGLIGSLGANLQYKCIAVQLPPSDLSNEMVDEGRRYLDLYFPHLGKIKVCMYWGNIREFSAELRQRWEDFKKAHG